MSGRIDSPLRVSLVDEAGNELAAVDAKEVAKDYMGGVEQLELSSASKLPDPTDPKLFQRQTIEPLPQSTYLLVTLGDFEETLGLQSQLSAREELGSEFSVVSYPAPSEASDWSALGLDSVDAVIVDARSNVWAGIDDWVADGGHLIVSLGQGARPEYLQRLSSLVAPAQDQADGNEAASPPTLFPEEELVQLRSLDGLENYARQNAKIPFQGTVPLLKIQPSHGTVIARQFADPLIYQVAHGFGRITLFSISINRPPISAWERLPRILKGLLISKRDEETSSSSSSSRITQSGVSDLATQMVMARESFEGVDRVSTWSVLILLAVYGLIVGPLDHLIVARLFKRPQLTWVTAPILIVGATVLTVSAARSTNADQVKANTVEVVDYDASASRCRFHSFSTIYSPIASRHDIAISQRNGAFAQDENPQDAPMRLHLHGLPEVAFGGMYRPTGIQFGNSVYEYDERLEGIRSLPIQEAGTVSLHAEGQFETQLPIQSTLKQLYGRQLTGTITHQLPSAIKRWIVVYGDQVYYPSGIPVPIEPFVPWTPDGASRRVLEGYLTATRAKVDANQSGSLSKLGKSVRNVKGTYDTGNDDVVAITRMITFHEAAGGREYTGLNSNDFRRWDFSDLVKLDRAVLFGEVNLDVTNLQLDGESVTPEKKTTLVRIVLPVTPED